MDEDPESEFGDMDGEDEVGDGGGGGPSGSSGGGSRAPPPAAGPSDRGEDGALVSPGQLIERTIFKKDTTLLEAIRRDFEESLNKNKRTMISVVMAIIAALFASLFVAGVLRAPDLHLQVWGIVLASFLSIGLGIQVGTMFHSSYSKSINKKIEGINELIKEANQSLTQMDFIVTEVLKKKEAKCTEEILNDIKIKNIAPEMTTRELRELMDILANRKEITQPDDPYTVLLLDIPDREIKDYIGEDYLARVTRMGQSNLGYKTLFYVRHEFSKRKIKDIKKSNPTLRKVNMDSFLEAGSKLIQELGKLGISYKDVSDETRVWIIHFTGHERRELIAKIKRLKSGMVELSKVLALQEEKFNNLKVLLDTTIAVLLLAVAGMMGFFIDMFF